MDGIQKRAHDFACAAVQCYQSVENANARLSERYAKYDIVKLREIYLEAYDEMKYRLEELPDQVS